MLRTLVLLAHFFRWSYPVLLSCSSAIHNRRFETASGPPSIRSTSGHTRRSHQLERWHTYASLPNFGSSRARYDAPDSDTTLVAQGPNTTSSTNVGGASARTGYTRTQRDYELPGTSCALLRVSLGDPLVTIVRNKLLRPSATVWYCVVPFFVHHRGAYTEPRANRRGASDAAAPSHETQLHRRVSVDLSYSDRTWIPTTQVSSPANIYRQG